MNTPCPNPARRNWRLVSPGAFSGKECDCDPELTLDQIPLWRQQADTN